MNGHMTHGLGETRSQIVWRHMDRFVRNTGASWPTLAAAVSAQYEARVPKHLRRIEFSQHHDPYERQRLDAQTLRRFEHDHKFGLPADIEEACVYGLRDVDYADFDRLMADLADRYGLLAAPKPMPAGEVGDLGRMLNKLGKMIEAMAPMLADGRINEDDAAFAKEALRQINDVLAMLISTQARIHAILPEPVAVPVRLKAVEHH